WPAHFSCEHRGRVDPGAEKRRVAEGEITRVAAQDVPRGGEYHPVEDEVEEGFVKRRQPEEWHYGQENAGGENADQNFPGRKRSTAMRSENDTSGAHAGAVSAMVTASLTPTISPATSGPSGLPSR